MSVAYLFGAGASRKSLPIVSEIPAEYQVFLQRIQALLRSRGLTKFDIPAENEDQNAEFYWERRLLSLFKEFKNGILSHASIDTYAKKLYLTNKEKLWSYKFCLSAFLYYSQIQKGADQRYDTFYASILQENIFNFPKDLRILSWNYDTQFEIAYSNYSGSDVMEEAKELLNIISKQDVRSLSNIKNEFNIIKLNGTIGIIDSNSDNTYYLQNRIYGKMKEFDQDDLTALVSSYSDLCKGKNKSCLMSFAWENFSGGKNPILDASKQIIKDVHTLVVIGYSFPYFNRMIDRLLFFSMPDLKKVYIQDPSAESLVGKVNELLEFGRPRKVQVVPVINADSFLIPNELN